MNQEAKLPFLNDHIPSMSRPHLGGYQYIFEFSNGYSASVIKNKHSYGGRQGLWELAILDKDGNIVYGSPISNDVIGYLGDTQVSYYLYKIADLPPKA